MKKILTLLTFLCLLAVATPALATDYYVDADVSGGTHDGSAANPWQTVNWTTVNTALASANVTIYFSCREASSDTSDTHNEITVLRTTGATGGPFRLTLDGMTKWNQNDTTPSWADYSGSASRDTPKAKPINQGSQWAIGWGQNPIIPAFDYVTIRGFETTGSFGRVRLEGGGSHFIVEYLYIHDVTSGGPGLTFNAGGYAYSAGPTTANPSGVCTLRISHLSDDVIFRYNHITNTADENLYFGGNGEDGSGRGFNCAGHSNIQFIGNTLSNPGAFGIGEGDCFDMKNGNRNVTYSGNFVGPCWRNGIPPQGAAVGFQPQTLVIENNLVHDTNTLGGTGAITLIDTWTTVPSTATIRNNIVYNGSITANDGDSNTDGDGAKYNIDIYNNTVDAGAIVMKYINTGSLKNNIVLAGVDYSQVSTFTDDYNAISGGGGSGTHSIALTPTQVAALFVDRAAHNYVLANTSSAAYNTATNTGCPALDYFGGSRPQAVICDIGADELSSTPPTGPTITSLSVSSGVVGDPVTITGLNFASTQGSSSITFNGTTATASSWSSTSLLTSVPSGATTGNIVVRVSSNNSNGVLFTVNAIPPSNAPPVTGDLGRIVVSAGKTNIVVSWVASTDDSTAQTQLQYQVYRSLTSNITTVATIEANGTIIRPNAANLTSFNATGLTPNHNYCFNIIVKDTSSLKSPYVMKCVKTRNENWPN